MHFIGDTLNIVNYNRKYIEYREILFNTDIIPLTEICVCVYNITNDFPCNQVIL